MKNDLTSEVIERLKRATKLPGEVIAQKLRELAINKAMRRLEAEGKSPFDIGREGFEALVADEEKNITVSAATRAGLASLIALIMSLMVG